MVLYHDSVRHEYMDQDFMIPEAMEMLEHIEIFQITVILSMAIVISLKIFGTFLALRYNNPEMRFNPAFIVSGVLGVFVGYVAYMGSNPVTDTTYIDVFMCAGFYALGANLMVEFASKVKNKLS